MQPGTAKNWFRQRSQSGSHTSDSESPNRLGYTNTIQPRRRISKTKLSSSLSPNNNSHLQITNVLKTPDARTPMSPIQGASTAVTNIISHTPRVPQSQGGRRHRPAPLGMGNGLFSDPDLGNNMSPRDMTAGEKRGRGVMSEKQFVKLEGLELSTSEIFYDKQILGIENKYSDSHIEKSKH